MKFNLHTSRQRIGILFAFLLFASFESKAQNLAGVSGMFNAPTANVMEDGTLILGFSRMDKEYGGYDYASPPNLNWDGMPIYASTAFFPWLEVQFRWTNLIDRKIARNPIFIPDRMATIRMRVLNGEDHWYPSVLIGFEDFARLLGVSSAGAEYSRPSNYSSPSYYSSSYLVASKKMTFSNWTIEGTVGYGFIPDFPWMVGPPERVRQEGLFGGAIITWNRLEGSGLIIEYDSFQWNIAARMRLFNRIQLLAGFYELKAFSGGISYRMKLWSE